MRVPFSRLGFAPIAVKVAIGEALLEGELKRGSKDLAFFSGRLTGKVRLNCDLCAEEYDCNLNEEIKLALCEGVFDGESEKIEEAIIECEDVIDCKEILRGEIASIKCDYHRCERCKANN
ncbi:MAG: hypothetical protein LBQ52_10050 [Helicobacteraceae bacterium]|jgi:hypothetical protein|nr:hypothetical protein [Helicobacteraceae bacterium]